MSTTFGRVGRWMLLAGAVAAVLSLVGYQLIGNSTVGLVFGILATIGLAQGVVFTAIQFLWFGNPRTLARVAESGRRTVAVITSIDTTSSRVGSNPVMILGLTVDGRPRRHRLLVPIHLVGALRPGATLPVRVDPADPRPLVVDWAAVR